MTFRFEKLTIRAQQALATAQEMATDKGNPEISVLHLLSALLNEVDGVVEPLIQKIGGSPGATEIHRGGQKLTDCPVPAAAVSPG